MEPLAWVTTSDLNFMIWAFQERGNTGTTPEQLAENGEWRLILRLVGPQNPVETLHFTP